MSGMDEDIATMRSLVRAAWRRGDWLSWYVASCVLLAWRIAYWAGVR